MHIFLTFGDIFRSTAATKSQLWGGTRDTSFAAILQLVISYIELDLTALILPVAGVITLPHRHTLLRRRGCRCSSHTTRYHLTATINPLLIKSQWLCCLVGVQRGVTHLMFVEMVEGRVVGHGYWSRWGRCVKVVAGRSGAWLDFVMRKKHGNAILIFRSSWTYNLVPNILILFTIILLSLITYIPLSIPFLLPLWIQKTNQLLLLGIEFCIVNRKVLILGNNLGIWRNFIGFIVKVIDALYERLVFTISNWDRW